MFGMGFTEILLIAIVAIIALGPEKLPKAMVDVAKFFRAFKKTIDDAKQNIDREIKLSELKEEALSYKKSLQDDVSSISQINLDDIKSLELDTKESVQSIKESVQQESSLLLDSLNDLSGITDSKTPKGVSQEKPSQSDTSPKVMIDSTPKSVGFGENRVGGS